MNEIKKINFFTPITFGDQPKSYSESLLETVDSYFYWGGQKAFVIPKPTQNGLKGAILSKDSSSLFTTALKIVSYALGIVVMLIAKIVLRSIHSFYIIDAQQELQKGIDIPENTAERIQRLNVAITRGEDHDEITWHVKENFLIFSLKPISDPDPIDKLIFKRDLPQPSLMNPNNRANQRLLNKIQAQRVCLAHRLDLLVLPHAKKFSVAGDDLIAEELLDIPQNEGEQEESGLDEAKKQLGIFIAKTGFKDVNWRALPIPTENSSSQGARRIVLIDLGTAEMIRTKK